MKKLHFHNILDEILFDIAENEVWCDCWGEKPSPLERRFDPQLGRAVTYDEMFCGQIQLLRDVPPPPARLRITYEEKVRLHNHWQTLEVGGKTIAEGQSQVRKLIRHAPRLVPICGRRFMATEPHTYGQPVLSIFMGTDIIFYGKDLAD